MLIRVQYYHITILMYHFHFSWIQLNITRIAWNGYMIIDPHLGVNCDSLCNVSVDLGPCLSRTVQAENNFHASHDRWYFNYIWNTNMTAWRHVVNKCFRDRYFVPDQFGQISFNQLTGTKVKKNGRHFADDALDVFLWMTSFVFWIEFHWIFLLRSNWQ